MITFDDIDDRVVLTYEPEQSDPRWVDDKLDSEGTVKLLRTFTLRRAHVFQSDALEEDRNDERDLRRFVVGSREGKFRTIYKEVLGLKYDLRLHDSVSLSKRIFVAERGISVFRRIDELSNEPIVIGGEREGTIPIAEFYHLLRAFPKSTEMTLYARARISRILREYFDTMSDVEQQFDQHMKRKARTLDFNRIKPHGRIAAANTVEKEKLTYVRARLSEMLDYAESYTEAEWQLVVADLFLLIYPQYITVLQNLKVREDYSKDQGRTNRYIDLALVDSNGRLDIIEIKKPFERALVSQNVYRDNHIPKRELSGTIMQTEKYLFFLSKSGTEGERDISERHAETLPNGLKVKILNPKAYILAGRDNNLSDREKFDFEFVRRQYSNMIDIITYDDLLRRLDNSIAALVRRESLVEGKTENAATRGGRG